jgi:biopolymer transport protein ExbD
MAFERFQREGEQPMAEINTTPLVDVMLVLLIIFMVTAPLLTHSLHIDLPRAGGTPSVHRPDAVTLSIDAEGVVRWNGEAVEEQDFSTRLTQAAAQTPQPEIELRADRDTRYQRIAAVLSAVQRSGLTRLSFVTEPEPKTSLR